MLQSSPIQRMSNTPDGPQGVPVSAVAWLNAQPRYAGRRLLPGPLVLIYLSVRAVQPKQHGRAGNRDGSHGHSNHQDHHHRAVAGESGRRASASVTRASAHGSACTFSSIRLMSTPPCCGCAVKNVGRPRRSKSPGRGRRAGSRNCSRPWPSPSASRCRSGRSPPLGTGSSTPSTRVCPTPRRGDERLDPGRQGARGFHTTRNPITVCHLIGGKLAHLSASPYGTTCRPAAA